MPRMRKYLEMNDLNVGMRVEVYHRYSSESRNGLVVSVDASNRGIMVDGKPVQVKKNGEVTIAYDDSDEKLILTSQNVGQYQISRM